MNLMADVISGTIAYAVPLLLVALGGMYTERSGIINIALEGIMIFGALFGYLFFRAVANGIWSKSHPQLTVLFAILISAIAGGLYSLLLAFASIKLKADQTIGGTALDMFAPAFSITLTWVVQGQGLTFIKLPDWVRITPYNFGMTPSVNPGFWETLFFRSFYLTTPIAFLILIAAAVVLYRTKFGLRLRSCGEHPQAADSVGINVYRMRYAGVFISGILGGIGGLAITFAVGSGFQSDVAGYGFLALAVMIFGNWRPFRILGAALFFAFFKNIAGMSGSIPFLPSFKNLNYAHFVYYMLPYIVTMIVLAFTSRKSRAPKAEGIPYDQGAR